MFVDFDDAADIDKAIKKSGEKIKGQAITLDYGKPKPAKTNGDWGTPAKSSGATEEVASEKSEDKTNNSPVRTCVTEMSEPRMSHFI